MSCCTCREAFDEYLDQKRAQYGDRFDTSELHSQFIPYFRTGQRIRVQSGEHVRTGTVGVTTGWKPAFLLIHRSSDHGSADVLSAQDQVTHLKCGRTYVEV
jgi:hypothetical protein